MSRMLPATVDAKLRLLPAAPGVYLHKDERGRVIYVGKAKRLNQRVRSYFQPGADHEPKTASLVERVADFDYIATETEAEALVLENQLIKEYRPRFNVRLKDDKQYPYLRISLQEPYPRVTVVRRIESDGARYFGPYTDVRSMRDTLRFAAGLFQVRTCALDLPDPTVPRPCLDYQIGRCSAPCTGLDDLEGYGRKVRRLVQFLEGQDRRVMDELRAEMDAFAGDLRFEEAARVRDRLVRLERTVARSLTIGGIGGDADLCGVARDGADATGVVLRVRQGKVLTTHHFQLTDRLERDTEVFVAQLLREYYGRAGDIPGEVLLSHPLSEPENWEVWLQTLRGRRVRVRHPRRGAKRRAVELAAANAAYKLGERTLAGGSGRSVTPAAVQLQEALGLHAVPETIECFDISNFQGRETVGSLVYFRGGEPLKARYRRFRIRTVPGTDDLASMGEVLDRYYGRLAEQGEAPADLVMVDGGSGQVAVARRVLARHGFANTQLVGLAKREETIHRDGEEIRLPRSSSALKLLQRVRDEAHRFAITYHRLLRDRRTVASALDLVPGIGEVKKLSLLHRFGSLAGIARAAPDELLAVRGIGRQDVANLTAFFAQRPDLPGAADEVREGDA
ncbi:MAG: excinuclease ABC subunit UvrC [Candidatus Krumholzibacteriia bacterium]